MPTTTVSPAVAKSNLFVNAPKETKYFYQDADFTLYLRAFWPKAAVIDGSWTPPAAERQ